MSHLQESRNAHWRIQTTNATDHSHPIETALQRRRIRNPELTISSNSLVQLRDPSRDQTRDILIPGAHRITRLIHATHPRPKICRQSGFADKFMPIGVSDALESVLTVGATKPSAMEVDQTGHHQLTAHVESFALGARVQGQVDRRDPAGFDGDVVPAGQRTVRIDHLAPRSIRSYFRLYLPGRRSPEVVQALGDSVIGLHATDVLEGDQRRRVEPASRATVSVSGRPPLPG